MALATEVLRFEPLMAHLTSAPLQQKKLGKGVLTHMEGLREAIQEDVMPEVSLEQEKRGRKAAG